MIASFGPSILGSSTKQIDGKEAQAQEEIRLWEDRMVRALFRVRSGIEDEDRNH